RPAGSRRGTSGAASPARAAWCVRTPATHSTGRGPGPGRRRRGGRAERTLPPEAAAADHAGMEEPIHQAEAVDPDEVLLSGRYLYVQSSNVYRLRYLYDEQRLEVEFLSGGYYEYLNVPPEVARDFVLAESFGKFVHARLKGRYACNRLRNLETYFGK